MPNPKKPHAPINKDINDEDLQPGNDNPVNPENDDSDLSPDKNGNSK